MGGVEWGGGECVEGDSGSNLYFPLIDVLRSICTVRGVGGGGASLYKHCTAKNRN
jgi:hypothetical protein